MIKKSMVLIVKDSFSSAHYLGREMGKCSNIHGHTWYLSAGFKVAIPTPLWASTGVTVDFKDLKEIIRRPIEILDHHTINDFIEQPSAEKISQWVWEKIEAEVERQGWVQYLDLEFLEIWEGPNCGIRIEKSKEKSVKKSKEKQNVSKS